jgi:hypothetical protein
MTWPVPMGAVPLSSGARRFPTAPPSDDEPMPYDLRPALLTAGVLALAFSLTGCSGGAPAVHAGETPAPEPRLSPP